MVVGFDYFEQQLSTVMDKYLKFYNDPEKYKFKREKSKRYSTFKDDPLKLQFITRKELGKAKTVGDNIVLKYPVEFTGNNV
jgi:hypothetical protein